MAHRCSATNANGAPCRAWAMPGSDRCRSHRDDELGARGAGAPPGNQNARKHGAYSAYMTEEDFMALALAGLENGATLEDEIAIVRVAIRRLAKALNDPQQQGELIKNCAGIFAGAGRVAQMLRTQHAISGNAAAGITGAIATILDELNTTMHWTVKL